MELKKICDQGLDERCVKGTKALVCGKRFQGTEIFTRPCKLLAKVQLSLLLGLVMCFNLPIVASGQKILYGKERGVHAPITIEGFTPLQPTLRKWYVPQELYKLYNWGGWEYTNYAKEHYQRYVNIELEGLPYYDIFGNYISKGWQIYGWNQTQPRSLGSSIFKSKYFSAWFDRVLIASDSKGQYYTSLTIGEGIRTTLTPLTFSKPSFNGIQWDFLSDKYAVTVLESRISGPEIGLAFDMTRPATNFSNFVGFRGTVQLGGFTNVGVTYVNSHIGQSTRNWSQNSLKGILSTSQNAGNVREVTILIADDSPDDLEGGATFYSAQLFIDGKPTKVKPRIEGGIPKGGFWVALGDETIKLHYTIPDPTVVRKLSFALVLADDYRVEVTSNLQTNAEGQPVYLLVTRAKGNVKDNTNQKVVSFDYGLPTGNDIYGVTLNIDDLVGFSVRGEYNINRRFRRFPNINYTQHTIASDKARAWFLNVTKIAYPWYGFAEFFNIDYNYNTSVFIPDNNGFIDYENENLYKFEYVDDNDDQDRFPDWKRPYQGQADEAVFPGLDENNDMRPDFNQNNNLLPDYDEPFLRYDVDPPEFLFGMDVNHNTVIDRFENDNEADYPYKRDHQGYNLYGGVEIVPNVKVTLGYLNERMIHTDQRSKSTYALFTLERNWGGLGRLRVFDNIRAVRDNIPDNLFQWVQSPGTIGSLQPFDDPLLAKNTLINTAYTDFYYTQIPHLNVINKVKYEVYHQRSKSQELRDTHFIGIISKLDYSLEIRDRLSFIPKAKIMYRKRTQPTKELLNIDDIIGTVFLISKFPVLRHSWVEVGLEYSSFSNRIPLPEKPSPSYVDDFRSSVFCIQFSNMIDYLGYNLTTNMGFQIERKRFKTLTKFNSVNTSAFIAVYASATR